MAIKKDEVTSKDLKKALDALIATIDAFEKTEEGSIKVGLLNQIRIHLSKVTQVNMLL